MRRLIIQTLLPTVFIAAFLYILFAFPVAARVISLVNFVCIFYVNSKVDELRILSNRIDTIGNNVKILNRKIEGLKDE